MIQGSGGVGGRNADDGHRFWSHIAPLYDFQLRLELPAIVAAVDLAAPTSTDRLLDAGTGTGAVLREVARRGIRPATVIGIDASKQMLNHAPSLPTAWELRVGDVRKLLFPDNSFDVVIASYLLHLISHEQMAAAIAEFSRVLAPRGRLVTVTPTLSPTAASRLYALVVNVMAKAPLGVASTLRAFDPSEALETAGFEIRNSRVIAAGYRSLCLLAVLQEHSHGTGAE